METFNIFSLGLLVNRVHTAISIRLHQKLKEHGLELTVAQYMVMRRIFDYQGITQKELAILIRKDQAAINRAVKGLINNGFLIKGDTKKDRNKLFLTQKTLDLKNTFFNIISEMSDDCLSGISDPRRKQGIDFLKKIYANLASLNQM